MTTFHIKGGKFTDLFTNVNAKNSHKFKEKLDKRLQKGNPSYAVRYTDQKGSGNPPKGWRSRETERNVIHIHPVLLFPGLPLVEGRT